MAIHTTEIRETVNKYLTKYPGESDRLVRLIAALDQQTDLTSRREFRGHVTCGVVLLDPAGRVLRIHHNALSRWLLPGGHLEPGDASLSEAALRELTEETGIDASQVQPMPFFGSAPIDIDVHPIPASNTKGEAAHWHFDFRYVLGAPHDLAVDLQQSEVADFRWSEVRELPLEILRGKLWNREQVAPLA